MIMATAASSEERTVWDLEPGEVRKPGIVHVVMLALFTGIGIVVGTFGSLAVPIGFVSAFWPGQAVQSIGAIWFGWWGGIAAALFPLISNSLSGSAPLPVSVMYLPGNLLQGMIAAWAFRYFKTDPSLKTQKDWIIWIVFGALLPNLVGAAWGSTVLVAFGLVTQAAQFVTFLGWFIGNSIPTIILGSIILKFVSPLVVKTKAFCKGLWA
jgi:integral membrane sensor domain MASE1